MPELGEWQERFLSVLFCTVLLLRGRVNFSNLASHSKFSEKTYRRGFRRDFDFKQFNLSGFNCALPPAAPYQGETNRSDGCEPPF